MAGRMMAGRMAYSDNNATQSSWGLGFGITCSSVPINLKFVGWPSDMQKICMFPWPYLWIFNNFLKISNTNLDINNQYILDLSPKIDKIHFISSSLA